MRRETAISNARIGRCVGYVRWYRRLRRCHPVERGVAEPSDCAGQRRTASGIGRAGSISTTVALSPSAAGCAASSAAASLAATTAPSLLSLSSPLSPPLSLPPTEAMSSTKPRKPRKRGSGAAAATAEKTIPAAAMRASVASPSPGTLRRAVVFVCNGSASSKAACT